MDISELIVLVDIAAPLSLVGMGWVSYLQTHSQIQQRTGIAYASMALLFPTIALSDPGTVTSLLLTIAGAMGIGLLRYQGRSRFDLGHQSRSQTTEKDPSAHPIRTDQSS